jgi:hypothetical protein
MERLRDLPVAPRVAQGEVEHAAGFVGLLAGGNLTRGDAGGDPVAPRARRLGDQGEGCLPLPGLPDREPGLAVAGHRADDELEHAIAEGGIGLRKAEGAGAAEAGEVAAPACGAADALVTLLDDADQTEDARRGKLGVSTSLTTVTSTPGMMRVMGAPDRFSRGGGGLP